MARTKGSVGFKTKQKYLHEKFPDQGWMEETDKKVINDHYQSVMTRSAVEPAYNFEPYTLVKEGIN